ncbi:MAG TPA: hemerythrin domain-containing protein, partial [Anaeromyxobacteraceae bacterium]|nr:hemerythrin domain-containing protein [Anaeromyxobacteraceae bacterium]
EAREEVLRRPSVDAIDLLMEEHRLILGACDALAAFGGSVAAGGGDRAELGRFVRFIREFADARHHGKEEDILFTAMVAAGFPRDGGPIAVMLMDHEAGRAHVGVLAARAEQSADWSAQDRTAIVDAAQGYADLLRGHIRKEDHILYPMARMRLHDEQLDRVNRECAAFEERQVAAGADALKELGRELVSRHAAAP